MALTKTIELKMKLSGLLIERVMITEKPDITGALIAAKRRSVRLPVEAEQIAYVEAAKPFEPRVSDPFGD